jgi:hypothetical protein
MKKNKERAEGYAMPTSMIVTIVSLLVIVFTVGIFIGYWAGVSAMERQTVMAMQKEKEARLAAYQVEMATQKVVESEFKAKASEMRADEQKLLEELARQKAIEASNHMSLRQIFPNEKFIDAFETDTLNVNDLSLAENWYRKLFKPDFIEEINPKQSRIKFANADLILVEKNQFNSERYYYHTSLKWMEFQLKNMDISPTKSTYPLKAGVEAMDIKDPFGNEIRFVEFD